MAGRAGASGNLAATALFDMTPTQVKPTARVLNALVAALAGLAGRGLVVATCLQQVRCGC